MPRGGKIGNKGGRPSQDKITKSFRLLRELVEWLKAQPDMTAVVEMGIRAMMTAIELLPSDTITEPGVYSVLPYGKIYVRRLKNGMLQGQIFGSPYYREGPGFSVEWFIQDFEERKRQWKIEDDARNSKVNR